MSATSDYLSLALSFPNQPPMSIASLFFLGLMRVAPIVAFVPFLGSKLPGGAKMGIAVALTVIILPHIIVTSGGPISFNDVFIGYAFKELFMGMILAFLASVPFYVAQAAGVLIDFMRGSSSLQVTDPTMQTQVSPIGLLYNYVLIVLFFQIDGPFIFLDAVLKSYTIIPANGVINPIFFASTATPFWQLIMTLLTKFTALSIQLSAPALLAILMAEMFLGIANRLAQQVQIAFLGMSLKSLIGLALLYLGWFFILKQCAAQTLIWLKELDTVLQSMRL